MTKRTRTKLFAACGIIAALSLALGLAMNARSLLIGYHELQFTRACANRTVYPDGSVTLAPRPMEHHRDQLVRLGSVRRIDYRFRHVDSRTPNGHAVTKLLISGLTPPLIDFTSQFSRIPEPLEVTIWCRPKEAKAWKKFLETHDEPTAQTEIAQ